MNFYDAVASGKPFKKKIWPQWITLGVDAAMVRIEMAVNGSNVVYSFDLKKEVELDDWEIQEDKTPPKVTKYQWMYKENGLFHISDHLASPPVPGAIQVPNSEINE